MSALNPKYPREKLVVRARDRRTDSLVAQVSVEQQCMLSEREVRDAPEVHLR